MTESVPYSLKASLHIAAHQHLQQRVNVANDALGDVDAELRAAALQLMHGDSRAERADLALTFPSVSQIC